MKKVWTRMICSVLLFACCILPSTAMAVEGKEANVIVTVKAKLFCPEIAGLFCRIAGLFCHDSRANLSLKPVCFGIAIS